MGSTLGRVGMSALRPRQLFFWRMQREKSSSSWLSYDTMQRKLQTCSDTAADLMPQAAGHFWTLDTESTFTKHLHVPMPPGKYVPLLSSRVESNWQLLLTAKPQPQSGQALLHIMKVTGKQLHDLWCCCVQKGCCCGYCTDGYHPAVTASSCQPPVQQVCDDTRYKICGDTMQQRRRPGRPMLRQQSKFWRHTKQIRLTWSLEAHDVRQSSAALHSGSRTHAKICLPHLVPIFQIVDRSCACMLFTRGTYNHAA